MKANSLLSELINDEAFEKQISVLDSDIQASILKVIIKNLSGSAKSIFGAKFIEKYRGTHLFVLPDKEQAAYFLNDIETLFDETDIDYQEKRVVFFPTSYRRPYEIELHDNANVLMRSEVITKLSEGKKIVLITYPEALTEKTVTKKHLQQNTFPITVNDSLNMDFLLEFFIENQFEQTDFVYEPGQFSIRGGIIDIFSFSYDKPYRIILGPSAIESIRVFDPESQLSIQSIESVKIIPNLKDLKLKTDYVPIFEYLPKNSFVWIEDSQDVWQSMDKEFEKCLEIYSNQSKSDIYKNPQALFVTSEEFRKFASQQNVLEFGKNSSFPNSKELNFNTSPLPHFSKNFDLLTQFLTQNSLQNISNYIISAKSAQLKRIDSILQDQPSAESLRYKLSQLNLHEGFIDLDHQFALITEHHIFNRYHRFSLREKYTRGEAMTLKDIYGLKPGDFIVHVDHGVGRYDGLEKIEQNGIQQEAIRIIYKNDDILYISIHSLHRISKFSGKDGTLPTLDKIGANRWSKLKEKTKGKVKDIAKELIQLYAIRKQSKGFSFSPDTYLQTELEASFQYEDTPDQSKSTFAVKQDMEADFPMDRLVCGDVGFGKTEIAVRAAFKAVADSKQVAILVPTTILALQHYQTFAERLHQFPCKVDYVNRFKTTKAQKETLRKSAEGSIDILIGTHRLLSKDVEFKNLGLLIIDEEQKFGVSAKERLRQLKANVDTLTLTATPIPRTLQFSLMGARDLSVINTPPPNRQPIDTQVHSFSEALIRDAILYETSRGGQVFFVHNRIHNIQDIAGMIQRNLPHVKVKAAHGRMDGSQLEEIMVDFMDGNFDVLVSTTIIESGLDISNANTIIINEAQNYGLSDLHQLRGRVGRSNKKAFCYLLTPPKTLLTDEAKKRLRAIEEFSDLGSGFNIAMRDLDIRGAGNILGGEQSGFISEIGYEMYQNIINEAMQDLKLNEFKELFKNEKPPQKDCIIETDMALMIPDTYISNSNERLTLYTELDKLNSDEELHGFSQKLMDIYGPIPQVTRDLIMSMKLRMTAGVLMLEKIALKNNRMLIHFPQDSQSDYFQSDIFSKVLTYVQSHPQSCQMKQKENALILSVKNIPDILAAIKLLNGILSD